MSAHRALEELRLNLAELARQRDEWEDRWRREVNERHSWEARYKEVVTERDGARMERDVARAQAQCGNMSP